MASSEAIGSQVRLTFTTKFATFTPAQIENILTRKGFSVGQGRISNALMPQMPSILVPMFSKDDINIYINQPANQISYLILNTVNLEEIYKEVIEVLSSLNIISDVIANISFSCITRKKAKIDPKKKMTDLINKELLKKMSEDLGFELSVTSLRLAYSFPFDEGIQVILEPLSTSPIDQYFLNIAYQTLNFNDFNSFIKKFGETMIGKIIEEVEKIA